MFDGRCWAQMLVATSLLFGCSTGTTVVLEGDDETTHEEGAATDESANGARSGEGNRVFGQGNFGDDDVPLKTKNDLQMCVSDAEAAVAKAEELLEDEDDMLRKREIARKKRDIREVEKECLEGEQAEKFEGLSDYSKVEKYYREAKRKLDKYEKREEEQLETAMKEGIGGEPGQVQQRWENRPERCTSSEAWNRKMGHADDEGDDGAANISGSELIEEESGPEPVSLGRPDGDSTARGLAARYLCGTRVEGVDPHWSASDKPGTLDHRLGSHALEHDPRTIVGEAANDEKVAGSRRTIYRAVASYLCWSRTNWNLKYGYGPYLKCREVAGEIPSDDEIEEAMEAEYPDRAFELANLLHMVEKARKAKPEVTSAFAKLEDEYPKLREVFVEPAEKAEKSFEQHRERYADVYGEIEPITERLLEDPTSTPPDDCLETLRSARETIAEREGISVDTPDAVDQLRVGNPVAYQTTEAFAYCHYGNGDLAKARIEAEALDGATRKVNRSEFMYYARQDALRAIERKYNGNEDEIAEVLPNYEYLDQRSPMPLPGSTYRTPDYSQMMFSDGIRFGIIGGPSNEQDADDEEDERSDLHSASQGGKRLPVVESIRDHEKGKKITFVTNTETVSWQPRKCRETDKFSHYELHGNRMEAVYEKECWAVGDQKSKQVAHQHDPVVLPEDQAELVEPGMRVELFNNKMAIGDAAVVRAWKEGAETPSVYEMISLE